MSGHGHGHGGDHGGNKGVALLISVLALVLALVLGDRAEDSFRQSMLISQGNLSVFFSNGLVGSIMTLGLVMLLWPLFAKLRGK